MRCSFLLKGAEQTRSQSSTKQLYFGHSHSPPHVFNDDQNRLPFFPLFPFGSHSRDHGSLRYEDPGNGPKGGFCGIPYNDEHAPFGNVVQIPQQSGGEVGREEEVGKLWIRHSVVVK